MTFWVPWDQFCECNEIISFKNHTQQVPWQHKTVGMKMLVLFSATPFFHPWWLNKFSPDDMRDGEVWPHLSAYLLVSGTKMWFADNNSWIQGVLVSSPQRIPKLLPSVSLNVSIWSSQGQFTHLKQAGGFIGWVIQSTVQWFPEA